MGAEFVAETFVILQGKRVRAESGLYFQLIQKLIELLKGAGSQEVLMARLCLVLAGKDESSPGVFSLGIELEAVGDNGDQAACAGGWAWHICSKRCYLRPVICGN